jgi:DNA-binding NarL/FixJ family response regulator
MPIVRVLLADDHALILSALRLLVERIDGLKVVAEAHNGRDAVAAAKELRPDLAIMDISMKELNGIEATARVRIESPETRVLMLSSHADAMNVHRAIRAGASGYLVKDCLPQELGVAIAAVMRGDSYLSPSISKHVVSGFLGTGDEPAESVLDGLSGRQREVLQMIAEGKSTKEIAFQLEVSVKTIETHRAALMDRLGIHDVAGLVIFAVRHGLVSVDRPEQA